MPRNGSGTMSVTNTFTPNTTISSSSVNADLTDIATEITGSLPVNGVKAMAAPLPLSSGTVALPGLTFSGDVDTGIYRISDGSFALVSNGVAIATVASTGFTASSIGAVAPQGRLTLTTAVPVLVSTVSAATTIYYTPYQGASVPIYDGTNMINTAFTELSVLTTDTTKSPAAIGVSKVNDWFVWSDSGTLRLGHGPDWTSDTSRSAGTALTMVKGIWLNNASITNGPPASRGTYVGTTRSNGSSQLDFIFGALAANGTAGFFGVWNAYNRVNVSTMVRDSVDSWTYATATWRAANGNATMRVSYVAGLSEDSVEATYHAMGGVAGAVNAVVGVGLDTTTNYSGTTARTADAATTQEIMGMYRGNPGIGFHFLSANEYASGATATFYGDNANATQFQTGLMASVRL